MTMIRGLVCTTFLVLWAKSIFCQWADISEVTMNHVQTELGGPVIEISYELSSRDLSEDTPVYVFIRYSVDNGNRWQLMDPAYLNGDGFNMVSSAGKKKVIWWGSNELGIKNPAVKIRGLNMSRIPAGEFNMKSFPAGGKDPSKSERPNTNLTDYYVAENETTLSMYVDYLNEMGKNGTGWHDRMANEKRCGIVQNDSAGNFTYDVVPGRENYPIIYVSWYDAYSFLNWCGLTLPTEAMWEKAFVGGMYLDGDDTQLVKNPNPERKYPWGDEIPYQAGIYRCNYDGDEDGFSNLAPVGSFNDFPSPYGVNDMAGNVAEWTLDWYTTEYHAGLDGFRMVRGGSWLAMPFACDAVSGATQFPIKESSIMGFRGVKVE